MPEKMPYQPTDDEIKKAEEMSPDDSYVKRYGQSEREYILEGKKGGKYGDDRPERSNIMDDMEIKDGKIMATRIVPTGDFDNPRDSKYIEISPENAIESLDKGEGRFRHQIDLLETAVQRIKKLRQEVFELKQMQEKKEN
jgi:hypothetical protein